MKKRMISLLTICALICTITISIGATDNIDLQDVSMSEVATLTSDVLCFIEPEKQLYGFSDINFSTLEIGNEIPAYLATTAGLVLEDSISYFPILNANNWVATAIITYDSQRKMLAQITRTYSSTYENLINPSDEIALVFDESCSYLFVDGELVESTVAPEVVPGRVSIGNSGSVLSLATEKIEINENLMMNSSNSLSARTNLQKYLMVPEIKQASGSLQCWAACIASIRGYYGTTTTIDQVYNFSGVPKYNAANIYKAQEVLENYGLGGVFHWNGSFNWYQLTSEIELGQPLFAACTYSSSTGHAVVLRSYYTYQNISQVGIIGYMDPVTGEYAASTVATDGDFYYVPSGSSEQYVMSGFLATSN